MRRSEMVQSSKEDERRFVNVDEYNNDNRNGRNSRN